MDKHWEKEKVTSENCLFKAYDSKYGVPGNYSESQDLFFNDEEIIKNLHKAIKITGKSPRSILSIGINNGREIIELDKISTKWNLKKASIVGFDLSHTALKKASKLLKKYKVKLIEGDISKLSGLNIATKKPYKIKNGDFDLCVAFTSLSSSNLFLSNKYNRILDSIIKSMKRSSAFIIVAPNCAIENGKYKKGGTYIAEKGRQDPSYAKNFIEKTNKILKENGYKTSSFGEKFIFLVATRN